MESFSQVLNFIAVRLPSSFTGYVTQIIIGLILVFILGSFLEHFIHRFVMHSRTLRDHLPFKFNENDGIQYNHAVLHHGTFYKRFDYESDPVGKELNIVFTADDTVRWLRAIVGKDRP